MTKSTTKKLCDDVACIRSAGLSARDIEGLARMGSLEAAYVSHELNEGTKAARMARALSAVLEKAEHAAAALAREIDKAATGRKV